MGRERLKRLGSAWLKWSLSLLSKLCVLMRIKRGYQSIGSHKGPGEGAPRNLKLLF
jgi:hypothetical protein